MLIAMMMIDYGAVFFVVIVLVVNIDDEGAFDVSKWFTSHIKRKQNHPSFKFSSKVDFM